MARFAVLGDPIGHSKSPVMHQAAYRALGMAHTYEAILAKKEDLRALIDRMRSGEFAGFNVTVPHKRTILSLVDENDESVELVGAANTLLSRADGKIIAANTDVPAIAEEIRRLVPERAALEGVRAVVLGTGGAALSAAAACFAHLGVGHVEVRGRAFDGDQTADQARAPFENMAKKLGKSPDLSFGPLRPGAADADVRVVIQATSAGMTGAGPGEDVAEAIAWDALSPRAVAYDVVYSPPETPFLRAAGEHGIRCSNGLGMLARQGALAFEMWFGIPAPYNAMLLALHSPRD